MKRVDCRRYGGIVKKRCVRVISCILTVVLCLGLYSGGAYAVTNEMIENLEKQVSDSKSELKGLKGDLSGIKKQRENLKTKRDDLKAYMEALDAQMNAIVSKIDDLEGRITLKSADIEQALVAIEDARQTEQAQYEAMVSRVRSNYLRGESQTARVIVEDTSLTDMLNSTEYVERVSSYEHDQLEEYIRMRAYIELAEQQLEVDRQLLEAEQEEASSEREEIEQLISDKAEVVAEYENQISSSEDSIKAYEAAIEEENETIAAIERAIKEERQRLIDEQAEQLHYDQGKFLFPLPLNKFKKLTSPFGWRTHPIFKDQRFHNGVDLAADTGVDIYAAYDGRVIEVGVNNKSMGNYVMIDHGDGLYTIYMHASKLYAKKGDTVTAGTRIAAVGSTGYSTGPHLHFGVRLNGDWVNPQSYINVPADRV